MANLSSYAKSLGKPETDRYVRKLTITVDGDDIALPDPYNLDSGWYADPSKLPPTQYKSIYNYLIKTPGPYTGDSLESYKSLDAYNYFISGHVKEVKQNDINDNPVTFVKALVQPGQRVTEGPFKPWLCLDKKQGYVISTHCTCMAGLGEACSHVAALLFAIEAVSYCGINNQPAATSIKCIWSTYYKEKVHI